MLGLEDRSGQAASGRLHAVVVPNFDELRRRKIVNAKEVIRYDIEGLGAQLPSTKRVGSYEIWQEDLPRTTTRKVKRFEVERRVRENQATGKAAADADRKEKPLSPEDAAWLGGANVKQALATIRDDSPNHPETIHPGDNLELDLGLDSMQRVELLAALEQVLGGNLEESRLAEIYTVRELVDAVRQSSSAGTGGDHARFAGWQSVLKEEPADAEVLALAQPQRRVESFWYVLTRMAAMFCYDRFQLKVSGLEKLPRRGPFLLCPNHQSYLDGVVISSVLPWEVFRDIFFVGTSDIFGAGFMRMVARWMRIMVLDPDANLIPAMRAGAFGLGHGRVLILFPEGERSIDGPPKSFKKGASILSIHLQVPIVPVAIDGFHDAWPRGEKFQKFARLKITFGNPIVPPAEGAASEDAYEKLTAELRTRVIEMWQELRRAS